MEYIAYVSREGKHWLAEFPDCPGCQTFADSDKSVSAAAEEALEGWLESHLVDGEVPPEPRSRRRAPGGSKLARVRVNPALAIALQVRWERSKQGLTQGALAKRAGVAQQQIAKLERPGENPTIGTIAKIAKALGVNVDVALVA